MQYTKDVSQSEGTNGLDEENVNSEVTEINIEDEMPSEPMRKNLVTLQRLKQNKENSKPCEGTNPGSEALSKQLQIQKPFANSQLSKKSSHSGNLNSHERTHMRFSLFPNTTRSFGLSLATDDPRPTTHS